MSRGGYRSSLGWRLFNGLGRLADRRWGWPNLRPLFGIVILIGARNVLRRNNLYDTTCEPAVAPPPVGPWDPRWRKARSFDGTYNDLAHREMGMAGSRFGRNVPIAQTWPEAKPGILEPSPRVVSRELLTRDPFRPATSLNSLAAAWLQFMIRDWFHHGRSPTTGPWRIEVDRDDPWPGRKPMLIMRTPPDPTRPPDALGPPTYTNDLTHWWDASSIYGKNTAEQEAVRSGRDGKLELENGLPPIFEDPRLKPTPAEEPGFWLGLAIMHTLFTLEHNAICDHLLAAYPRWAGDDDGLFDRARLINAALIAKIHTVEWTPAMINHPTTVRAMTANWWGLAGEGIKRRFGRISKNEVFSGILGSLPDNFGVPYSLTEEFVAVYRMHPMIRDDWSFRSHADDRLVKDHTFREITGPSSLRVLERVGMPDALYTFGTLNPGVVSLHNYPRFLQEFERPNNKELMDLAAVDIMRSRELGVPRYNEFRRLVHLRPAKRIEDITDNPLWADEIRRVYDDDVERVDLLVGMYAEPLPRGFAFSDTALRIFILMASRRLNSDRFFTKDFTPDVYTPAGMSWIDGNDMRSVLLRHFEELRPALSGRPNAFKPWALSR